MNINKYLENQRLILQLQEENRTLLEAIQKEAMNQCPFKKDDVIKGKDFNNKVRAIQIRRLIAHISDNGTIQVIAIGYPMNLNGKYAINTSKDREIYIDETTLKII